MDKVCSVKVTNDNGWRYFPCRKPPTVERAGQTYCTIHDPEREKRIREEKEATRVERFRPFQEAVAALGCGYVPTFENRPQIVLTLAEAHSLIERLNATKETR